MFRKSSNGSVPSTVAHFLASHAPRFETKSLALAVRNLALQDCAVLYLTAFLTTMAFLRAQGVDAKLVRSETLALFCAALLVIGATRGELIERGAARAVLYRFGLLGTMAGAYAVLRLLLPALQPQLLDDKLVALDARLFGRTPAVWLDPFVTPRTVEWFAFFYFSHYWLLATHLLGTLCFDAGRRRYELLLGFAIVAALGHSIYIAVPGVGPYGCAQLAFSHPLVGSVWWSRVQHAVSGAGAGLDIFPSMHTAFAVLIALHTVRYRREAPFSWSWLPTCFCVANIVIATVFLRWHYGVDLIAGTLLAIGGYRVAIWLWHWEGSRVGQEVWEPILPSPMPPEDRRWLIGITTIHLLALLVLVLSRQ